MNRDEKAAKLEQLRLAMAAVEAEPTAEELAEAREFLARQRAASDEPPQTEPNAEAARVAAGVSAVTARSPAPGRRLSYAEEIQVAVAAGLASVAKRGAA